MNTLANLYKQALHLFNTQPDHEQSQFVLTNLVSQFAISPYPEAIVDIIQKENVTPADKAFWQTLEDYGLSVRFQPRQHDHYAFVMLNIMPLQETPYAKARVTEHHPLKAAA